MFQSNVRTEADHHGRGRYSYDHQRWWNQDEQRWHQLSDETETLEIVLEDVSDGSWISSILLTLGSQFGSRCYRFVGLVRAGDPRPIDRVVSGTFPAPRGILAYLPPTEQWAFGMARELRELRDRLAADGWVPSGMEVIPGRSRTSDRASSPMTRSLTTGTRPSRRFRDVDEQPRGIAKWSRFVDGEECDRDLSVPVTTTTAPSEDGAVRSRACECARPAPRPDPCESRPALSIIATAHTTRIVIMNSASTSASGDFASL